MARELKRACEPDAPGPPKRARTCQGNMTISFGDDSPSVYRREMLFKYLPSSILSLAHAAQRIDTFLMSPEEAVLEAVKSEQHDWLEKLTEEYSCCVPDALVLAAKTGCVGIVRNLSTQYALDVHEAAIAAAEHGQLEVVELLVEEIEPRDQNLTVWNVMDAAARKGHLDIVRLATERAREQHVYSFGSEDIPACHLTHALSSAIAGGHFEMVSFMIFRAKLQWDRGGALDHAVALGQQKIIGLIYRAIEFSHDPYDEHDDLLSHVVCRGLLNALKYLYEHKHGSSSDGAVEFCFRIAAQYGHIHIMRFFLHTGRVTNSAFDKAFVMAASYAYMDTVVYLHGLNRASPKALTKSIQVAARKRRDCGGEIVKFLFDKGNVSEKDAIAAFELAAGNNNAAVAKLLLDIAPISDEIAITALNVAAARGHLAVVSIMRFEPFVSADIISNAFMAAAQNKRESVVKALVDDERISSATITQAFGDAGDVGCTRILRVLNAKQSASPEMLGQFISSAASRGHVSVVKYLVKNSTISEAVKAEAERSLNKKLNPPS